MKRRQFIAFLGGAAAWPLAARAQTPPKMVRVGLAHPDPRTFATHVAFEQRLHELGYMEGRNLAIEFIQVGTQIDRYDEPMRELVRRKVDIILAAGEDQALKAAMAATRSLPIVMVAVGYDPVVRGYVTSIARPTGNVTGVFLRRPELVGKQMELLSGIFPGKTRLGVLWDSISADMFSAAEDAAKSLHLQLRSLKLENSPYDFDAAFRNIAQGDAEILLVLSSNLFNQYRPQIAELAIRHRLPTMFVSNLYVAAGGLMSYGPSLLEMNRVAADYVDRIAKGAKPQDLPIEQPTKFELAINLKTAKVLGLTIPPSVLAVADEVIE